MLCRSEVFLNSDDPTTKMFKQMMEKATGQRAGLSQREEELSIILHRRLGINLPNLEPHKVQKEMKQFIKTGNFDSNVKMSCINLTFLSPEGEPYWVLTDHISFPFDAYFPVPFNDQPSSDLNFGDSAYRYCKLKLQSLATALKKQKNRITFHFHLNNCVEQCLKDEKLKNHFQVIHCPDLVDEFGLANVLIAATNCLASTPEAVLRTETKLNSNPKPTVTKYVEDNLSCPVSLIPTVYGVRLANHLRLGSTEVYEFHDCISKRVHFTVRLRWLRVPAYSDNIRLGITPDLRASIERLAEVCHLKGNNEDYEGDGTISPRPLTPISCFYILHSLICRGLWIEGAVESLIESAIPPSFQLAWKTLQNWISGKTVLFLSTVGCAPPGDFNWQGEKCLCHISVSAVQWWVIRSDVMIQNKAKVGQPFPTVCRAEAQRIEKLLGSNEKIHYMPTSKKDSSFALMLAMNHEMDPKKTRVCITDVETGVLIYYTDFFKWFKRSSTIVNSNPITPKTVMETNQATGLKVTACQETKTQFELDIGIQGITVNNLQNGISSSLY